MNPKDNRSEFEAEVRRLVAELGPPPPGYCFFVYGDKVKLDPIARLPHGRDGGCVESGCTCIPENLEKILRAD